MHGGSSATAIWAAPRLPPFVLQKIGFGNKKGGVRGHATRGVSDVGLTRPGKLFAQKQKEEKMNLLGFSRPLRLLTMARTGHVRAARQHAADPGASPRVGMPR